MSGFDNDIVYAKNGDFTQVDNQAVSESNGLITNGQLWIGTTALNAGGTHINVGTITSPDGSVTVGYSSPNITLQVNNPGELTWNDENSSFAAVVDNGYFVTAIATATLPASPSQGDIVAFVVDTASVLTITANTGQFIRIGNVISASAGTAASTARGDSIILVYRSAATTWFAVPGVQGNWSIT